MNLGPLFPKRSVKGSAELPVDPAGDEPGPHSVEGERGIASVSQSRSLQSRVSNLMAMGLMGVLGLGLLSWYYAQTYSHRQKAQDEARASTQSKAQGDMPLPALGRVDPPEFVRTAGDSGVADRFLGGRPTLPQDGAIRTTAYVQTQPTEPMGGPMVRPADRRLDGPVFSSPESNPGRSGAAPSVTPTVGGGMTDVGAFGQSDAGAGPGSSSGSVAALLRPTVSPAVRARVLPTQQLLLPKGAFIDCTLETAIDSSLPGLTTCVTATDTFGCWVAHWIAIHRLIGYAMSHRA